MKTLIFDVDVAGHHLEYLHHFYIAAVSRPNEEYVFFVSPKFKDRNGMYNWPEAPNITILYCTEKQAEDCVTEKAWKAGIYNTLLLRKVIKQIQPDTVLLTTITVFIPYARFLLPRKSRIRGIMYTIYSYEKNAWPTWRLEIERWRIKTSVNSKIFDKIYLLNDELSCEQWNGFYKTTKFNYLVDPVPTINIGSCKNIREQLKIDESEKVFLHFGGMAERKGTLNILKAINNSSHESLNNKVFVFAGRIYNDIHDEFYQLLEKSKEKAKIIVYDEFVSYEFIYNLCYTTDFVLMPYKMSNLSSGLLGYASIFKKTVIGPKTGLLGTLINKYDLGYTIDVNNINDISDSFRLHPKKLNSVYGEVNTLNRFLSQLFDTK